MFSKKLSLKVLAILGISLAVGFTLMGIIATKVQIDSLMAMQEKNSRNTAAIVIKGIQEYMLRGDAKEVARYVSEAKNNRFVHDLKIFNNSGIESGSTTNTVNPRAMQAIQAGKDLSFSEMENGIHTLALAIPLQNETKCHGCHDAQSKFLGTIILTNSIQDGYDSAKKLLILLLIIGTAFFFAMLATIHLFIKKSVINNILEFVEKVNELASGQSDLTKSIPVNTEDEIGELAKGINRLISKIHDLISQMGRDANQIAAASQQLSITSEKIALGINEVVSQADSVATASEEMAATSGDIARNCLAAAEESRLASDSATTGSRVVEGTVDVMSQIAIKVKDSAVTIEMLGKKSDQIGEIIGVIQDIADQTNLLALNAAIEAARAGEQGRGFAVVADEVRALADRTTKATREIGEMIKATQTETRGAVKTMEEGVREVGKGTAEAGRSGAALNEILERINSVTMQVNQIATAAEEQTATTSEISRNILNITDVIQSASKSAQESAAAAFQLAKLSDDLQNVVRQFKL